MSYNKETGMYEGYIYKIVNDINDKVYIGQTIRTIKERWEQHKYESLNKKDNMIIHKAMNKYGIDNFKIRLIKKIKKETLELLKTELDNNEIKYIEKYNSVRPNGYNISSGGGIFDLNCKLIDQYDLNCNFIKTFNSIVEASMILGIGEHAITKCVTDKSKTAGGYVFVYYGKTPHYGKSKDKKINQYTLNNEFMQTFNSIKLASKTFNIFSSNITDCCKKKRYKTAGGYKWFYANDPEQPDKSKIID